MKFVIEVTRMVSCVMEVETNSEAEALELVRLASFKLPEPDQWSVNKHSYRYEVITD